MGTLTAASIINKAVIQLNDLSAVRWTRAELLTWLSDAQRVMILAAPSTGETTGMVTTVPGIKQTIPMDGWLLIRANRNMGSSGTSSGRVLQLVQEEELTKNNPTWSSDTATGSAVAYSYAPILKNVFWVYPPADASGNKIEVVYSQTPTELTTESSVITVLDVYEPALLDYVMYKACSKDAEYAAGLQLAAGYLSTFNAMLGIIDKEAA